jgi:hypothetical protein
VKERESPGSTNITNAYRELKRRSSSSIEEKQMKKG